MAFTTLDELIDERAATQPDGPCMLFEGASHTYSQVRAVTNRMAGGLASAGVAHGTKVAILIDNKPEIVLLYLAIAKLGAVAVPLNTAAKGELLAYFVEKSESEFAVCDAVYTDRLQAVLDRTQIRHVFEINEQSRVQTRKIGGKATLHDFKELAEHTELTGYEHAPVASDPFMLLYTSGTTGRSKASVATHHSALTVGRIMAEAYEYSPTDVLYICLPLFHGNAWQCATIPALVAGGAIAITRRFSVSSFWKEVHDMGVTQFNIMSSMTNFLWSQPPSPAERDHKVRQCMLVPTPAAFYDEFRQRFNIETIQSVYALTDVGVVTITTRHDPPTKRLSAGRADKRFEVKVFGPNDEDLAPGDIGEIVVRNRESWVMPRGYYKDPERTAAAWQNLWFHTGDRGYLDQDGFIYFVDRKKDAIRRRGENISSYEVEQLVLSHPSVKDIAAYPVPSKESEDEVAVSVVRREGHELTELQLTEHCRANMPYYMVPRFIEFVDALPLTMTGKVEKYKLVQDFDERVSRIWDREQAGIKISR